MANENNYKAFVIFNFLFFFIVSIIQIAYGSLTYTFSANYKFGAFYVGSILIFLFPLSFSVRFGGGRGCYIFFSILCFFIALVGSIIDFNAAAALSSLHICTNTNGDIFGNAEYRSELLLTCPLQPERSDRACYCFGSYYDSSDDDSPNYACIHFIEKDGFSADNCDPILNEYESLARTSGGLCLLLAIVALAHSIGVCSSCCCLCMKFDSEINRVVPTEPVSTPGVPVHFDVASNHGASFASGGVLLGSNGQPYMVPSQLPYPHQQLYSQQMYIGQHPPIGPHLHQQQQYFGQAYQQMGTVHTPHVVVIHQAAGAQYSQSADTPLVDLAGVRIADESNFSENIPVYTAKAI